MIARHILATAALLFIACAAPAQTTGTVSFLKGDVSIRTPQGALRAAERGSNVETGDTVETGDAGRAQLRMVDGAYISLQPKTALRLDAYRLASATQDESGVMTLLKGGLRTVTGLIGRTDRKNYQLNTSIATVGIRGTEFLATADEGTRVRVAGGAVALCTEGGGCLHIPAGQTGFAADRASAPILVAAAPSLPPAALPDNATTFALGEQRDYPGKAIMVSGAAADSGQPAPFIPPTQPPLVPPTVPPVVPPPTGNPVNNGTGLLLHAVVRPLYPLELVALEGTLTFDGQGRLSNFVDSINPLFTLSSVTGAEHAADGVLAWGRWTTGSYLNPSQSASPLRMLHYVAASNATAPTGTVSGTFTTYASTAPTLTLLSTGLVLATGTSNSVTGSIALNSFSSSGGGTGNYTLNVPLSGQTYVLNANIAQLGATWTFADSNGLSITGLGCPCTAAAPGGAVIGMVNGDGADRRVGTTYGFNTTLGIVSGAVVFK